MLIRTCAYSGSLKISSVYPETTIKPSLYHSHRTWINLGLGLWKVFVGKWMEGRHEQPLIAVFLYSLQVFFSLKIFYVISALLQLENFCLYLFSHLRKSIQRLLFKNVLYCFPWCEKVLFQEDVFPGQLISSSSV